MMMINTIYDWSVQLSVSLDPEVIYPKAEMRPTEGCCPELLLRAGPPSPVQVHCYSGPPSPLWSTATLVQVVSVSCHRWRLAAGDISHKPLRLRCACPPDYIHRWRRSRALETQALEHKLPPAQMPYLAWFSQDDFYIFQNYSLFSFYDAINSLCLHGLSVLSTLCAVYF